MQLAYNNGTSKTWRRIVSSYLDVAKLGLPDSVQQGEPAVEPAQFSVSERRWPPKDESASARRSPIHYTHIHSRARGPRTNLPSLGTLVYRSITSLVAGCLLGSFIRHCVGY
ncbi:hypothetical protein CBL_04845 [Carabus blaptoides fortunei]